MTILDALNSTLASGGLVALPVAFVGGAVMGLNPCCLAAYPAAAATCCAGSCATTKSPRPVLENAALFVIGNAVAITVLGVLAAALGRTFGGLGRWFPYLLAVIPLVMGLHLLGWLRLPMPKLVTRSTSGGKWGSFVGGLLLPLAIGACGTPVLAAILSYAAAKGSVGMAAGMLFAYGLGNSLPLLLVGTAAGELMMRLERRGFTRWAERVAGVAMLGFGFSLLWTAR